MNLTRDCSTIIDDRVAMFSRRSIKDDDDNEDDDSYLISTSLFTVTGFTSSFDHLNSRAIVTHTGTTSGDGTWKCTKDRNQMQCRHINEARDHLQKLVRGDPDATDARRSSIQTPIPRQFSLFSLASTPDILLVAMKDYNEKLDRGISHLAILPPKWASLDTDRALYARPDPVIVAPQMIPLDVNSRSNCLCQSKFDVSRPVIVQECTIYTLNKALPSKIQVQPCPTCPAIHRRYIGPDSRELGIFNLDNEKLFAHDLLDEYTSAYTSSETPFVAWTLVLSRRYEIHNSALPFVNDDTFRDAWFSFSLLQDFEGDMRCTQCGPTPEDVIWDGVTLAFNKKQLLTSMRPPTSLDNNSINQPNVRYDARQQLIPNAPLRKLLREAMNGPGLPDFTDSSGDLDNTRMEIVARAAAASAGLEFIALLEKVEVLLRAENDGVADVFVEHFGVMRQAQGYVPPNAFRRLFLQVCQIS